MYDEERESKRGTRRDNKKGRVEVARTRS